MGGGGKGGSKKSVIGYKFYVGLHMVFCQTPDAVLDVAVGERSIIDYAGLDNSTRTVDKPDLFGGERKEGGVQGEFDICFGRSSQGQNPYLKRKLGDNVPAFRGVLSIVAKQMYLSAMSAYLKPWWVKVERIPGRGWYPNTAEIQNGNIRHANPAHILYELITENSIGEIDDASFRSAANVLYNEGFGLSFIWNGGKVADFIDEVINHIGGVLYVDPTTGKFVLKLIRKNYDVTTLPVFDESNIVSLDSYQRKTLSDTVNQIIVTYQDADSGKNRSVTVQDLANIQAQGQIVSQEMSYPGIPNHGLATRVAQREITAASALLAKIDLKVNRDGYRLKPGDVFVLRWEDLGIEQMVCRVGEVDYGTIQNGIIKIKAVEDVFALPDAVYAESQPALWTDPIPEPAPCPYERLFEASYWELRRNLSDADFDYLEPDSCFLLSAGARPHNAALEYLLTTSAGDQDTHSFAPVAMLVDDIDREATIISVTNEIDTDNVIPGETTYAVLNDEIVRIDAISPGSVTIGRGCLDTVPQDHTAGSVMYFNEFGYDETEYAPGQNVTAKLLPITGKGQLAPDQAAQLSITMNNRFMRPYPPAHLRVNGILYPAEIAGDMTLQWYHRDRTQQTSYLVLDNEVDIGPEPGVTYRIEVKKKSDGTVLYSDTGITANNVSVLNTDVNYDGDVTVTLWSERDGYQSWQSQVREFQYWRTEPRETETGIYRTTESGTQRIVEG